jgi:ABC-type nitrate/sulfonate/bicarbonate transport system permease component
MSKAAPERRPGLLWKLQNPQSLVLIAALVTVWQIIAMTGLLPGYMLPSPVRVIQAFIGDFSLLLHHLGRTLLEALWGLLLSVAVSLALAIFLDTNRFFKWAVTPLLLLTQTMPAIAIAPLLILWMGYGMAPKITLIFLTCFFPLTIGLLDGFDQADVDAIKLLQSMGAKRWQLYRYIKIPQSMGAFFSGLKIASSYAIIGAVISEWLGGDAGLGVYMIRVRRSYSFDKMFAVILLVSALSLVLIKAVTELEKIAMPYKKD